MLIADGPAGLVVVPQARTAKRAIGQDAPLCWRMNLERMNLLSKLDVLIMPKNHDSGGATGLMTPMMNPLDPPVGVDLDPI